jgi:hypothetical protein
MALASIRRRFHAAYHRYPAPIFWLAFALLNLLLFLPLYLLGREMQPVAPLLLGDDWRTALSHLFVWRAGVDPFRISIELTLLTALWVWVPRLRSLPFRIMATVVYLLALLYAIYEAVVLSVWLLEPNFYSQIELARDNLPFLLENLGNGWLLAAGALLALVAGLALVLVLLNALFSAGAALGQSRLGQASRALIAVAAVLSVVALVRFQFYTARAEMVASSIGYKIERNVIAARALRQDVLSFDDAQVQADYTYTPNVLVDPPDIYLIFVESYGSVLYKRADYRVAYRALLADLEEELAANGWQSSSSLSISPMWGGGSWLAYTSALLGVHVDNQPQYLSLLNKYQVDTYPSLGRALQDQGYRFAWLSALDDNFGEVAWQRIARFYGVDTLYRHDDLNYSGPGYGWGPAPADQYTLNHAIESLKASSEQPLFLFTITQNSHYPWTPLPTLVDDWRTLSGNVDGAAGGAAAVDPDAIEHSERRANYLRAIEYELQMLARLIAEQGDDNSLFVLVGDHQPPAVSRRDDGWETPIHIVSRNPALVERFAPYGFTPGLAVEHMETELHHEGIYSLLMRVLTAEYSGGQIAAPADLPAYLPGGALPARQAQAGLSDE